MVRDPLPPPAWTSGTGDPMKNKYRITAECIRGDSEHYPERSDKMAIGLHKTIHIQHWAPYYSLHDLFWIGCHPTPGTNKDKSAQTQTPDLHHRVVTTSIPAHMSS